MQISLLNERITFQRNVILTDRIGNHMSSGDNGRKYGCFLYCPLVRPYGDCQHHRLPHNVQKRNL